MIKPNGCGKTFSSSLALALAALLLAAPTLRAQQSPSPAPLPDGDGKALIATACTQCHALTPIIQMRDGQAGWKDMVEEMVLRGAQLTAAEADTVIAYLVKNFGPGAKPFESGTLPPNSAVSKTSIESKAITLPDGPGKEMVQARCALCHDIGRVVTVRRPRADWDRITRDMIARGPAAPADQVTAIINYLATQFGK